MAGCMAGWLGFLHLTANTSEGPAMHSTIQSHSRREIYYGWMRIAWKGKTVDGRREGREDCDRLVHGETRKISPFCQRLFSESFVQKKRTICLFLATCLFECFFV